MLVCSVFAFDIGAFSSIASSCNGDSITRKTLSDMKASIKKLNSKHILLSLIYYIMGLHCPSHRLHFGEINSIVFLILGDMRQLCSSYLKLMK